ncbi:sodium-independent sulfate anion transporter-like [Neocloeon triangulifer]|uniref:sodium-independent sulfate anion transporter-like n=1 Tax=Neocloeon triangulifer TaxID=2078957 RepID=UPI00286F6880|nr:sodium-independent sulfate anion transporter-like [Neocloeon triangulifer]XP_059477483.1 sodium-independent sulfate anion transporter-like [Neocloeon triangulifer]
MGEKIRRLVRQRVPIVAWLPGYDRTKFICDLIAGVTVGLTVIPQALAYSTLAGLEPQYGLYSAFMGCFMYIIFGGCKDITIGPTALMSLMTYDQVKGRNKDFAVLLCFLTGCVQMLFGILNLGVLLDFISVPVSIGFTSATSVIIIVSQLKGLLGLKFTSSSFLDNVAQVLRNLPNLRLGDTLLGLFCIIALLLLRKAKDFPIKEPTSERDHFRRILKRSLWLVSVSRNILVVIICSLVAFCYEVSGNKSPFLLIGAVQSGLPSISLPPFSTTLNNQTLSFTEMASELGSSIILVPVIAILGNVAIAKTFSTGDSVDATQEMIGLGMSNLAASLTSAYPVDGSFSRSAVNHASGVQTPMGGLYTGVLVLLALSLLTPYFYFIPKATLAAVIICAVIFMIEYEVVTPMWRSSKKDLVPTFTTFAVCLAWGVEYGILAGVAINIIMLLYPSARPTVQVNKTMTKSGRSYLMVTPGNSLYFPAVDFIRTTVGKAGSQEGTTAVVVDCKYVLGADFTAAKGIAALIEDFKRRKQPIYFYNLRPGVIEVFKGASLEEFIHFCDEDELENYISREYTSIQSSSNQGFRDEEMKPLNQGDDEQAFSC